jgi:adenylate cyclase
MGVEIERKFLVRGERWKVAGKGMLLRQGYLCSDPERVVRVRIEGEHATLTIKGKNRGATRSEWEYPIPREDAQHLLDALCERPLIEKVRHRIAHAGMLWEIDEFLGENAGLVVAEIELTSEDQAFARPNWLGEEVTHDARYFNANLLRHPYSAWR